LRIENKKIINKFFLCQYNCLSKQISAYSQFSILNSQLAIILALLLTSCAPLPPIVPQTYRNITGESSWDDVLSPWVGTPYLLGGNSKRGVDCSGFTSSVYMEKEKKSLPRTSIDQFKSGISVDRGSLAIGDLVFFGEKGTVSHVGIYTGSENFIHASTSKGVTVSPLDDSYWKPRYMGARRY
jgi:cell wall-associated NlpC family hydrolase